MRSHMQLTAPLVIACSALLLCIGVIVGLTGSLIMQASNSGRPAPVTEPASTPLANAGGVAVQAPAMGSALVAAAPAVASIAPTSPAANVPAAVQTLPDAPVATAPPAPPAPAAEAPQVPAAPAQEAPPMVGAVTSAAEAQGNEVDPATFQQDLQPMGQWVTTADYGACWAPQGVAVGWRPYSEGRWVYTECGWTWVSEEPWGHITYHYGSWVDYPGHGWLWVPGRTWAPAWVAWRVGGGYVGWAPLPPAACRRDIPVADAVVLRIPTPYFCFVGERDFGDEHIGRHMRPIQQNVAIIVQTRNSTHIEFSRTTVVNRSLSIDQVEHMTGRRPQQVRLERSDNNHDAEQGRQRGEPVAYRPRPQPVEQPRDGHQRAPTVMVSGLPTPPIPVPTPANPVPRPPVVRAGNRDLPTPPIPVPPLPGLRPADATPAKPLPQPAPKPAKQKDPGSAAWTLPAPQEAPAADKPPAIRPAGPEPRKPAPQPAPSGEKQPSVSSDPTRLPPPPQRAGSDSKPTPMPPTAVRPADAPQRHADPEPAPVPQRQRERAPEPASPPPAPRPADPAPSRAEAPARPQPSEALPRRQPAPTDNTNDDSATTPGQTPDNSGKGGGRRGGR